MKSNRLPESEIQSILGAPSIIETGSGDVSVYYPAEVESAMKEYGEFLLTSERDKVKPLLEDVKVKVERALRNLSKVNEHTWRIYRCQAVEHLEEIQTALSNYHLNQ